MNNATIKLCNLTTGYKHKHDTVVIAHDISAELHSGELTCLLGSNGAGKSTLLRTLSLFLPAVNGDIELMGKPLSSYSSQSLATVVGVVLTEKPQSQNITVEELVALGRSPYTGFWGKLSNHDHEIVNDAIATMNIDCLRKRLVHTLSDGERQKAMIAKVLAQETPIIFLDEPTAFLDYPSKVEIMQLLQRLAREKDKTIFLSTHDLELALQIADTLWLLDKSKGLKTGSPEDLSLDGSLEEFFSCEGIKFDAQTGLYKINAVCSRSVTLSGEMGLRRAMVVKALTRVGIKASLADSDTVINIDSRKFTIWKQNLPAVTVNSIADLINQLK